MRVGMRARLMSVILMLFATAVAGCAQDNDTQRLEMELKRVYKNKVVILREFHSGSQLEYDEQGQLLRGGPIGPWTLDGEIRVSKLRLKEHLLEIDAERLYLMIDQNGKSFNAKFADKVRIKIALSQPDLESVNRALSKVFLARGEKLEDFAPLFWRPFLTGNLPATQKGLKEAVPREPVLMLGKDPDITAPVQVHTPEPPYTEVARQAKFQGTLVLSIVIDEHGDVREVIIRKPLGLGLDENAVQTVSGWKFKPALRSGAPIDLRVMVEVTFRLW